MRVYNYLIRDTGEMGTFSTQQRLHDYLTKWHLTDDESSILVQSGIYHHENMGIIEYQSQLLDFTESINRGSKSI